MTTIYDIDHIASDKAAHYRSIILLNLQIGEGSCLKFTTKNKLSLVKNLLTARCMRLPIIIKSIKTSILTKHQFRERSCIKMGLKEHSIYLIKKSLNLTLTLPKSYQNSI